MKELLQQNERENNFGKNLQTLRSRMNMSQEDLAEKMNVSRQSVSKWESGTSYPEMPTLIALCDLFHIDMDTLLRGSADQSLASDEADYDNVMNRFALFMSSGVGIILVGVSILIGWTGLVEMFHWTKVVENLGVALFLIFILAAVVLFIVAGIRMDNFQKKFPVIQPFYTQKQKDDFSHKFVWLIAIPVAVILAGVILLVALGDAAEQTGKEYLEHFLVMIFMLMIAGAVTTFVWAGIQESKYDIEQYNLQNNPEYKKIGELTGTVCSIIMLLATAFYLYRGFTANAWPVIWMFPVGGICCGMASIIIEMTLRKKAKEKIAAEKDSFNKIEE